MSIAYCAPELTDWLRVNKKSVCFFRYEGLHGAAIIGWPVYCRSHHAFLFLVVFSGIIHSFFYTPFLTLLKRLTRDIIGPELTTRQPRLATCSLFVPNARDGHAACRRPVLRELPDQYTPTASCRHQLRGTSNTNWSSLVQGF